MRCAYILGAVKLGCLRWVFITSFTTRCRAVSCTCWLFHVRGSCMPPCTTHLHCSNQW